MRMMEITYEKIFQISSIIEDYLNITLLRRLISLSISMIQSIMVLALNLVSYPLTRSLRRRSSAYEWRVLTVLYRWLVSISLMGIAPSLEGHAVSRDIIKFLSRVTLGCFHWVFLAQKFFRREFLSGNSIRRISITLRCCARKFLNIGISNCA